MLVTLGLGIRSCTSALEFDVHPTELSMRFKYYSRDGHSFWVILQRRVITHKSKTLCINKIYMSGVKPHTMVCWQYETMTVRDKQ